jgi:lipid A disaccharide synthetase
MKKLFIISGEKSGDLIANDIIKKLKEQYSEIEIKGVGGKSFEENGLHSLFNQNELAIMGFTEILPKLKRIFQLLKLTKEEIYSFKPEHIITIDSPGFNFQVAKFCQHARLSKKDVRKIFLNYTVKKSKKDHIKIIKFLQQTYNTVVLHCDGFVKKYKILTIITNYTLKTYRFFKKVFSIINNRYTSSLFKVLGKFLFFCANSHIVHGIFLMLFKEVIAVIIILHALIIYLSTYKYLRYPLILANKIYQKILHNKEAEKDLSNYFKTILLTKLEAKNAMYCNAINILENLPKQLKLSFIIKGKQILTNLHKKFKKEAYSRAFECKIHHIVAPSVWAYKKHRVKKVAKLYNTLFCILPFEPQYFTPFGLKTIFIGYPPYFRMKSVCQHLLPSPLPASVSLRLTPSSRDFRGTGLPPQTPIKISITLGSRISELKHHIPIIKNSMNILNEKFPKKLEFCIILLPHLKHIIYDSFKAIENVQLIDENEKWKTIISSRFVIGKSGTNIMEFALLGVPSIVYYKTGKITAFIVDQLVYMRYATLLNFTAQEYILPEFLQKETQNLHTKAIEWLENDEILEQTRTKMQKELEKFASAEKPEEIVLRNL